MITGVITLVLAATTAALPFIPPVAWVQLPQRAVAVHGVVWKGPKALHGPQPALTAVAFPSPLGVGMLSGSMSKTAGKNKFVTRISNTPLRLCGVPARMIVTRVRAAGGDNVVQQVVAARNGYGYMLMYTRPAGTPADARILHAMRAFCPSGSGTIQVLQLPAGWTKDPTDMQTVGMWMGTQPGQMMMLMRGSQMASLDQVFTRTQEKSLTAKSGKNPVKIVVHRDVTMCGYPGMLVDVSMAGGPLAVSSHMAITQGAGASYVLSYVQMGNTANDPAAMASLRTLCAAGASPAPSASPVPTATPLALP